jgi:hypothetical protein
MKNPKSALRGDHASAMMLLGGELQDATGAPFGMGKNPKTCICRRTPTPIEDKALRA